MDKYVVFQIGQESYSMPIADVVSIEPMHPITRVPTDIDYVRGVMNLRGTVIPVLDLRIRLGLEAGLGETEQKIIVLSKGDMDIGMMVDGVDDVIDIADEDLQPPTQTYGEFAYVSAMARLNGKVLPIFDPDLVIETHE